LAVRAKQRALSASQAAQIADDLLHELLEANRKRYTELQTLCRSASDYFPLRTLYGRVAEHQLALLTDMLAEILPEPTGST
jgi:hypothetical protein